MDRFIKSIDKQIASSEGKNIFFDDPAIFQFVSETVEAISKAGSLDTVSESVLVDYATQKAMEAFFRVNQYYAFDAAAKQDLRKIYSELFAAIRAGTDPPEELSKQHYAKLKDWLKTKNPFAEKLYGDLDEQVKPVPCSEYRAKLQIDILHLDMASLKPPVLDVGCGRQGQFVHYCRQLGIESVGIDRYTFDDPGFITADWLEFEYGTDKWGAIVSHLGFSNHFHHHHLREDGNYLEYGRVYMKILHALKVEGRFYYAPALPFIESYLDGRQFSLTKYDVEGYDFQSAVVQRLR